MSCEGAALQPDSNNAEIKAACARTAARRRQPAAGLSRASSSCCSGCIFCRAIHRRRTEICHTLIQDCQPTRNETVAPSSPANGETRGALRPSSFNDAESAWGLSLDQSGKVVPISVYKVSRGASCLLDLRALISSWHTEKRQASAIRTHSAQAGHDSSLPGGPVATKPKVRFSHHRRCFGDRVVGGVRRARSGRAK